MKIAAIGDKETLTALRLIGIANSYTTKDKFNEIIEDSDVGLILITEEMAESLAVQIDNVRMQKLFPIIVEIPDKKGTRGKEDAIGKLIKRAVGVELGKEK